MKKFKNIFSILFVSIFIFAFVGCSANMDIQGHNWKFKYLMQSGDIPNIVACGEAYKNFYPEAQIKNFAIEVDKDSLTLTGEEDFWLISFEKINDKPDDAIYQAEISKDGVLKEAMISVGLTTYDDGTAEYTLLISTNEYVICFCEEK